MAGHLSEVSLGNLLHKPCGIADNGLIDFAQPVSLHNLTICCCWPSSLDAADRIIDKQKTHPGCIIVRALHCCSQAERKPRKGFRGTLFLNVSACCRKGTFRLKFGSRIDLSGAATPKYQAALVELFEGRVVPPLDPPPFSHRTAAAVLSLLGREEARNRYHRAASKGFTGLCLPFLGGPGRSVCAAVVAAALTPALSSRARSLETCDGVLTIN
eukprot:259530-Rhodomonas_salina.2